MEYFSKLDNKTFKTKEALIDHLISNYSMTVENDDHKDIIDKIKRAAPLVEVNSISKDDKDRIIIDLSYYNDKQECLDSEDIVVGKVVDFDYYDYNTFENLESMIEYVSSYYKNAKLLEGLLNQYNIDNDSFVITGIHTGGHDSNSEIYYRFSKDGEVFDKKLKYDDNWEEIVNQVKSIFIKNLEGTIENTWESCSHSQIFRVNGVDLDEFLVHGKKVKIEILD
ncbi:hypothetical protein [Lysinibacillus sp. FSL K6-0102]|uniref:hypothetical protein n=1 Tax=Lysinibacillus sp. FSL K6-0102 TaxID=2975290 RepID=UPI0030F939DD